MHLLGICHLYTRYFCHVVLTDNYNILNIFGFNIRLSMAHIFMKMKFQYPWYTHGIYQVYTGTYHFSPKNSPNSPNFSKLLQTSPNFSKKLENLWRNWRTFLQFRTYHYIENYISSTCSIFSKRGSVKVHSAQCS